MSNPETYNVRVLAVAYGISMKRVDAILRLKGMEKAWMKVSIPVLLIGQEFPFLKYDEPKNRLVFKTPTWLKPFIMHGFLIFYFQIYSWSFTS